MGLRTLLTQRSDEIRVRMVHVFGVTKNEIEILLLILRESLVSILRHVYLMSFIFEYILQRIANASFIVDY